MSTALFDLPRAGIVDVRIPLSPSIFKRLWPKSIRSTAFHVTDYDGVAKLKKMQGKKRSISAFYNMDYDMISYGIRTEGGYVVELEGDVLAAAADDIASAPDKSGRRWITLSTLLDPISDHGFGGGTKLKGFENEVNEEDVFENGVLVIENVSKDIDDDSGVLVYSYKNKFILMSFDFGGSLCNVEEFDNIDEVKEVL